MSSSQSSPGSQSAGASAQAGLAEPGRTVGGRLREVSARFMPASTASSPVEAFEPEVSPEALRTYHPDLAELNDASLERHFAEYGETEGRVGARNACREHFVKLFRQERAVLEIGPFARPLVEGRNASYFDVLDRNALRERAKQVGMNPRNVPKIDFVSPVGDLDVVDGTFSAVVSSHVIEHQPDLVRHLNKVSRILEPGGHYYLLIPDKRYCFDHYLPETHTAQIFAAYDEKRRLHEMRSVIEHRALTTHNDCVRHWQGDHHDHGYHEGRVARIVAAVDEFRAHEGEYIDVHAWQFTPASFRAVMSELVTLGLSDLAPVRVYRTVAGRNEFTAILRKADAPADAN